MRWSKVCVEALAYQLPDQRVASSQLEDWLAPAYQALRLGRGQVETLTGVKERRYWPEGTSMASVAAQAGMKALAEAGLRGEDLGAVVYGGVCRDNLEPATACAVAEQLGVGGEAAVFDISNACLGALNGIVEVANRIELGQIRAGLVVTAESARTIQLQAVDELNSQPSLERFRLSLATLTGGSGAAAILLTDEGLSYRRRMLRGGMALAAPQHHRICRWGPVKGLLGESAQVMETDATAVLTHGVALGQATWAKFLEALQWRVEDVDRVICHQVGTAHRRAILEVLGIRPDRDFSSFEQLGNMGTVSVPLTTALAEEAGVMGSGDRVALLGIGSGLNCLMLGLEWA